jgi:ABC-type branched-subunit amino acid transport system ATPase component
MRGLVAEGIVKQFGGLRALDGAAVEVRPGHVTGLIGRNGSGKSTLFNCISGFLRPDAGRVEVDGADVTGAAPDRVVAAGIVRSFQTPRLDFRTTVRDAVRCGFYPSARAGFLATLLGLPAAWREERRIAGAADALLARLGLAAFADAEIGRLSMGQVRLVEVARGMAAGARYLLLDEPAAGLASDEREMLASQIRGLAETGVGVLLVEHNFALVRALCDTVYVLDFGRILAAGTPHEIARDRRVIDAYLGSSDETVLLETGT